jgi:hypothetical protein
VRFGVVEVYPPLGTNKDEPRAHPLGLTPLGPRLGLTPLGLGLGLELGTGSTPLELNPVADPLGRLDEALTVDRGLIPGRAPLDRSLLLAISRLEKVGKPLGRNESIPNGASQQVFFFNRGEIRKESTMGGCG